MSYLAILENFKPPTIYMPWNKNYSTREIKAGINPLQQQTIIISAKYVYNYKMLNVQITFYTYKEIRW